MTLKNLKPPVLNRIIFCGVIFLLIFAPLAFGSVHVWAYSLIEILVFLLVALFFISKTISNKDTELKWAKTPVNGILILILILIGVQMMPMPLSWLSVISPKTAELKTHAAQIIADSGPSPHPLALSLSHYRHATIQEWLKLASYLGMFFLVLNISTSRRRIRVLVYVFICLGLFEALYAVSEVFDITPKIWWWKSRAGGAKFATGTFIGSNHFAGFTEMMLCITLGFIAAQKQRTLRMSAGLGGIRAGFQNFLGWFSPESIQPKKVFLLFSAVIMGLGLLLSASRAGILSLGAAMIITSVLFFSKSRHWKFALFTLLFCILTFAYGLSVGIDPTLEKFEKTDGLINRLMLSRTLIPMFSDYPVAGVGWGNFPYVYSKYAPKDHQDTYYNGYAHNDWLEAGTEVGMPGLILIVTAYFLYISRMIRIWRRRRDPFSTGIGAGVIASIISIGFHSFFDFNMHIPANPLTLAAFLGLGYSAIHVQGYGLNESFFYRQKAIPLNPASRTIISVLIIASFIVLFIPVYNHFMAESVFPSEWNSTMNLNWNPEPDDIKKALKFNPENSHYYYKQALHCSMLAADASMLKKAAAIQETGSLNKLNNKEYRNQAIESLIKALQLNPASATCWLSLGEEFRLSSYDAYKYLNYFLPKADKCYDMAISCAPENYHVLFNGGWYWAWRARLLPESKENPPLNREYGIKKFQSLFNKSLTLNPALWKKAVDRVDLYFQDDTIILGIAPEDNQDLRHHILKYIVAKSG